jgi:hypothetical protein
LWFTWRDGFFQAPNFLTHVFIPKHVTYLIYCQKNSVDFEPCAELFILIISWTIFYPPCTFWNKPHMFMDLPNMCMDFSYAF